MLLHTMGFVQVAEELVRATIDLDEKRVAAERALHDLKVARETREAAQAAMDARQAMMRSPEDRTPDMAKVVGLHAVAGAAR